eukprot:scaffold919_cov265-Chaetoceros_neogracile.AAC.20
MSFQYSTATKAVRLVPVLYYSTRCAETALKYIRYLQRDDIVAKGLDEYDIARDGVSRAQRNRILAPPKFLVIPFRPKRDPDGNLLGGSINAHLAA